jgi:light-independent protochlorophyllide reductase subunit B
LRQLFQQRHPNRTDTLTTDSVQKVAVPAQAASNQATWSPEAEKELGKIPFFVRGKARRNTERFAQDQGVATITVETLYDAKAHSAGKQATQHRA